MNLKKKYNNLIDKIFNFLQNKTRIIFLLIFLLILTLISYKFVIGLFLVFFLLALNTIIEAYRLFIPMIPIDLELLTFGTILLTLKYNFNIVLIFILLGLISMTISRGHFHPSFLVKALSLIVISLIISFVDYSLLKAMLAILIGIIIQLTGYILLGGDPIRNTISRTSNLFFNYFLLTIFGRFIF